MVRSTALGRRRRHTDSIETLVNGHAEPPERGLDLMHGRTARVGDRATAPHAQDVDNRVDAAHAVAHWIWEV
jgi:hypothetical protein